MMPTIFAGVHVEVDALQCMQTAEVLAETRTPGVALGHYPLPHAGEAARAYAAGEGARVRRPHLALRAVLLPRAGERRVRLH